MVGIEVIPLSGEGKRRAVTVSRKSEGTDELCIISGFEKTDSTKSACMDGISWMVAGRRELGHTVSQLEVG